MGCDLPHKISKIKANHNLLRHNYLMHKGVIYHTKLVKSKQITTIVLNIYLSTVV